MKPFNQTAVGMWLAKSAPDLLETIGDSFPPLKVVTSLITAAVPSLATQTPEQKAELQTALDEYTKDLEAYNDTQEQERTQRLQVDMTSDSWLSKNVRPLVLFIALGLFILLSLINTLHLGTTSIEFLDVLKEILLMSIAFYFVDRTVNKAILNNGTAKANVANATNKTT